MIITADPRPRARLAPLRPPGCPESKVPTGRHAAPDENIHDGVCLKERRLPSIRLNKPGRCSQQRNKVKASESSIRPTSRSKNQTEHRQTNRHGIFPEDANFARALQPRSRLHASRTPVGGCVPLWMAWVGTAFPG